MFVWVYVGVTRKDILRRYILRDVQRTVGVPCLGG